MQPWDEMVKDYERSIASVEKQLKKFQRQADKTKKEWERYELANKITDIEDMLEGLHYTMAQIKDRSQKPK